MSQRPPYSTRGAIAQAIAAYERAEKQRKDAEQRARATRDAAIRTATDSRDKAQAAAVARAALERNRVARMLAEIDQQQRDAERVLTTAAIVPPQSIPQPSLNASGQTVEQRLIASQKHFVDAQNRLVDALTELDRVRQTLLVRALRKIGLPPI